MKFVQLIQVLTIVRLVNFSIKWLIQVNRAFVRFFYVKNSGCSLVRLKCWSGGPEIGGSNPLIPTKGLKGIFRIENVNFLKNLWKLKRTNILMVTFKA